MRKFIPAGYFMKKATVFLILTISASLFAFKFRFKDKVGDKYVILTKTIQQVFVNNVLLVKVDQRNKGELSAVKKEVKYIVIKGKYDFYQRPLGDRGAYRMSNSRSYLTEYKRNELGMMIVGDRYYYPIVRNIPLFLKKDIKIGESWEANGVESQDFRKRGILKPFKYKVRVFYRYLKDSVKNGRNCAVIDFFYYVNQRTENRISGNTPTPLIPARFFGYVKGRYYWDKKRGYPFAYENNYDFVFINKNGSTHEFKGYDSGTVNKVSIITREDERDIERRINRINIPARITRNERGISLNFKGEVLFDFSSYKLKEGAKAELKRIAKILKAIEKKYPGVEFRIEGHADSIGSARRKQYFSNRRAKKVADYLISLGVNPDTISYRGFSDTRPVDTNSTTEGRSKNRRVEIIIITR